MTFRDDSSIDTSGASAGGGGGGMGRGMMIGGGGIGAVVVVVLGLIFGVDLTGGGSSQDPQQGRARGSPPGRNR
ncbi:hypothetical protein [Tsukamurella sp. PLM1]|uniref:hypothetical protein n=1 Tax=Tsukamurella sp. PLM1 TaxID=2929795 RepID=UPI0035303111